MTCRTRLAIIGVLVVLLLGAGCSSRSAPVVEPPAPESSALVGGIGFRIAVYEASLAPLGDQTITDLSLATALTVPSGATIAWIEALDGNIRWRDSGNDPTASLGGIIFAGDKLIYSGDLDTIKLIQESDADAFVSYYRYN